MFEVRRSRRGTLAALVNLALAWVTGVVVIGNQIVRAEASMVWIVTGGLLLLWGAMILSGLVRPVKLVLDAQGMTVVKLFGHHRFAWDELTAVDFERSEKFAVIAATVSGRARFAALAIRGLEVEQLARAKAMIFAKRPDLAPNAAGQPDLAPESVGNAPPRAASIVAADAPLRAEPQEKDPATRAPDKTWTAEGVRRDEL